MLDISLIRQNPELVKKNNEVRGCKVDIDEIITLDEKRRSLIEKIDEKRNKRNQTSQGGKPTPEEIKAMKEVKEEINVLEIEIGEIEDNLNALLVQLPNITHESTPTGKDENDNKRAQALL